MDVLDFSHFTTDKSVDVDYFFDAMEKIKEHQKDKKGRHVYYVSLGATGRLSITAAKVILHSYDKTASEKKKGESK